MGSLTLLVESGELARTRRTCLLRYQSADDGVSVGRGAGGAVAS
jgi:hypothetical protein